MATLRRVLTGFLAIGLASCATGSIETLPLTDDLSGVATAITGTLSVRYEEDPVLGIGELVYELREESAVPGWSPMVFHLALPTWESATAAKLREGDTIRARGVVWGDLLEVGADQDPAALTSSSIEVLASAPAAVEQRTLVMIANFTDGAVACTQSAIQDVMFGASYSVSDYYFTMSNSALRLAGDVVTVSIPFSVSGCDTNGWAAAADQAAATAGFNPSNYSRLVYVVPSVGCGWAGYGTLGGSPSRSWILGYCNLHDVYAHELGHNLGMHHANANGEYQDTSCVMGYGGVGLRGLNAPHEVQMGWRTTTNGVAGTYSLSALSSGAQATVIKVPIDPRSSDAYYISYRTDTSYDSVLPSGYRFRTSIHQFAGGASYTELRGLLDDGGTWEDTSIGLRVTQTTHDATTATVQVAVVCTENAPSLTVSPSQKGGTPGSTVTYNVTVTNQDGRGCDTRSLGLSTASAWPATLSVSDVALAAGATASVTLTVTLPSDSDGQSSVSTVSVTGGNSASVTTTSDGAPPSVPTGLTATAGKRQVTVAWNASSDASGSVSYRIYRDGALLATTSLTSYSDRSAVKGTFTYEVDAVDLAGNASAKSAPATVTIGTTTGRRK